jgi:hypothetical protein
MGTRSQTIFIESYTDEKTSTLKKSKFCTMYRHMDGYPSEHGTELAEFLATGHLVNGIGLANKERIFNGMGCLAAQVVTHFKNGAGGIYIQHPNIGVGWEDYIYEVEGNSSTKEIILRCFEVSYNSETSKSRKGKKIFEGSPMEWLTRKELTGE